jgi:hypothetical protein
MHTDQYTSWLLAIQVLLTRYFETHKLCELVPALWVGNRRFTSPNNQGSDGFRLLLDQIVDR